ncbi:MAG: hypothetical protein HZA72_03205 [Candidatus Omnitrophica bacterium]|nr:hypothetical protein [Candidatus Omnitrophota bacterium]
MAKVNIAKNRGSDNINRIISVKDAVIQLEDSLYRTKYGSLYDYIIREVERPLIEYALERTWGNQLRAAKILGINRNTMRSKIKKLGIDPKKWKTT